jgi:WD40 repeat protein
VHAPGGKFHLDGTAKIWDATTGTELVTLFGHTEPVAQVAWSPTGDRILTASYDGTVKVWDPDPTLLTLAGLEDTVGCVVWSLRGDRVAVGTGDGTAKVLDANTGEELVTFTGHTRNVWRIQWACKGERLFTCSADDTVRVWDTATSAELLRYDVEGYVEAALSPDETRIAMSLTPPGLLRVFPTWQTLEELMDYARECCVVRELTDAEREMLGLPVR